jgi:FkbM family methyltransferase
MMPDLAALAGLARSVAIYHGRPWRAAALRRFYAAFVSPGDLAFDVGAHVGNRSRALAAIGARVVALEPQPLFAAFLRRTLPSQITLREEAVGAEPERLTLRVSRWHPTVSTLSRDWIDAVSATDGFRSVRWDRSVEVAVTTLDRLIADFGPPRFVKIDVEGMEAEILRGLSSAVPVVAVEYLPAALDVAMASIDRLSALGDYRFTRVVGERNRFAGAWAGADAMKAILREAAADGRSGDLYAALPDVIEGLAGRRTASEARPGRLPTSTMAP